MAARPTPCGRCSTRPPEATGTISLLGFLLVIYSVFSLTRYLQRTYEAAWGLPPAGLRGTLNGLGGMALLLSMVAALAVVGSLLGHVPAATSSRSSCTSWSPA